MGQAIDRITLNGFKSIEHLEDFALGKLNVLIGANGGEWLAHLEKLGAARGSGDST